MSTGKLVNVNYILENGIKILKGLPLVEISKLKKNPKNIKHHTKEQIHDIMVLMKKAGFTDPMGIDSDFIIWRGHGRLEAAILLGMKKVPFFDLSHLSYEEKLAYLIMDNKVNESSWISENVKMIIDEVDPALFEEFQMNFDDYLQKNFDVTEKEWQNMPEFMQEGQEAYRRILIKFENEKDVEKFAKVINQSITNLTKTTWFPYKKQKKTDKEYVDES